MKLFHSHAYTGTKYGFDTTRKASWIADSLRARPVVWAELHEPVPATESELHMVHAPEYIQAVKTGTPRELGESQGFDWDSGLWDSVTASTGGVVAAARAAIEDGVAGSLSSGLHHARFDRGAGFCTFNGLALAAHLVLRDGARRVLILDMDAHCGGGTYSLVREVTGITHADVSVDGYDSYDPVGRHALRMVHRADDYLPAIAKFLAGLAKAGRYDLCLYNAGMDPYERCAIGGLAGITREVLATRERMVFSWCRSLRIPCAFVLAGGYTGLDASQADVTALHRLTIEAASYTHGH